MTLHEKLVVVDGQVISKWSPEIFTAFRQGGITAVNATCAVWENARATLDNIAKWFNWFDLHKELIVPVFTTKDILAANATNRTGIVLVFQNASPIEDRLNYLSLFKRLGVGMIQITYNTQNLVGSGCYESQDSGLSDFGREVVAEMNRIGIAIDLSHVGDRTAEDAIWESRDPVVFSHVLPKELKSHPRNKETQQLRTVAERGGLVGVTMFSPFLPKGNASTVDDYAEIIEWVVNACGEDSVGYGADFFQGYGPEFSEWLTRDKGYARLLTPPGEFKNPAGMERIENTPNLTAALERRRWPASRIEKIMGQNWLDYFRRVWHE